MMIETPGSPLKSSAVRHNGVRTSICQSAGGGMLSLPEALAHQSPSIHQSPTESAHPVVPWYLRNDAMPAAVQAQVKTEVVEDVEDQPDFGGEEEPQAEPQADPQAKTEAGGDVEMKVAGVAKKEELDEKAKGEPRADALHLSGHVFAVQPPHFIVCFAALVSSLQPQSHDVPGFVDVWDLFGPEYRTHLYRKEKHIANSALFNGLIMVAVLINTTLVGVEVDSAKEVMAWDRLGFVAIEAFFCLFFTFELLVRFDQQSWGYFQESWLHQDLLNLLDYSLVIASWLDVATSASTYRERVQLASTIRVFRFVRIVRMAVVLTSLVAQDAYAISRWPEAKMQLGISLGSVSQTSRVDMDPSEQELGDITNLSEAFNWAGLGSDLQEALLTAMGQPTRIREIALIPRAVWDRAVEGMQVRVADLAKGHRTLTPAELARVELLIRVCNLKVGRSATGTATPPLRAPCEPCPAHAMAGAEPAGDQRQGRSGGEFETRSTRRTSAIPGRSADQPKAKKTRAIRRHQGADHSRRGPDGLFTHNRKGLEVCHRYNQGHCGSDKAQGICKSGRTHQCDGCLGPHPNYKCDRARGLQAAECHQGDRGMSEHKRPQPEDESAPSGSAAKKGRSEARPPTEVGLGRSARPAAASSSRRPFRGGAEELAIHQEMGYGHWTGKGEPTPDTPVVLILFSGRPRPGDLADSLSDLGWLICAVDTAAITPTHVLSDVVWEKLVRDIQLGMFDCIWLSTPSGTFSPSCNSQSGPGPLRDLEHIRGVPRQLRPAEQKQLTEANLFVDRSAIAATKQMDLGRPWGWGGPDPGEDKVSIWKMPSVEALRVRGDTAEASFDQCRAGLDTARPTKLLSYKLDLSSLDGLRCDHKMQKYRRADGYEYMAAHESLDQKWVPGPEGKLEKASRAQGDYAPRLCQIIAAAIHQTAPIEWRKQVLAADPLP
eukprot:s3041_g1.t1